MEAEGALSLSLVLMVCGLLYTVYAKIKFESKAKQQESEPKQRYVEPKRDRIEELMFTKRLEALLENSKNLSEKDQKLVFNTLNKQLTEQGKKELLRILG